MKNYILITVLFIALSCEKERNFIEDTSMDLPEQEVVTTIINSGDASDIDLYDSKPYHQEEAGYQGEDFINLPEDRKLTFTHKNNTSDTEELEKMITDLSNLGGGTITIKSGEYRFRDVLLKSNIHITIESGTIIKLEKQNEGRNLKNGYRYFFSLSGQEVGKPVENVKIIGLGSTANRPKLIVEKFYESWGNTFNRAISFGYAKNVLIENFTIEDDFTLGAAIAFNPVDLNKDETTAQIAENVTIANISLSRASVGYGLAQTNVGRNILLKNLSCNGGVTCRIEAHTGRKYDLGVYNIVVKNVANSNGKSAVLLQPHSVENGRVLVDVAKSVGSSWTIFIKEGFVGPDSKRRFKGDFDTSSEFKNISLVATDDTATLSYKNFTFVPLALRSLYNSPNFVYITEDSNHKLDGSIPVREAPIVGPSIAAILYDATYALNLPKDEEIVITGKTEGRLKIFDR